ncbi:MAG TPA: dTDP-4-dehydrorhamnose 3,5-epimerase family protein [Afipia sp.]
MTKRIEIAETEIAGLFSIVRHPIGDNRGYLDRLFCSDELFPLLAGRSVVQINHTLTVQAGTVRGMHFQYPPHAETKIVSCLRGQVFDVAVDLRKGSPTFLRWHGLILSGDDHNSFYIPEGFAHGFQALTNDCEMLYLHTSPYVSGAEGGINADDLSVGIVWPKPVTERSKRDIAHPLLSSEFKGITI